MIKKYNFISGPQQSNRTNFALKIVSLLSGNSVYVGSQEKYGYYELTKKGSESIKLVIFNEGQYQILKRKPKIKIQDKYFQKSGFDVERKLKSVFDVCNHYSNSNIIIDLQYANIFNLDTFGGYIRSFNNSNKYFFLIEKSPKIIEETDIRYSFSRCVSNLDFLNRIGISEEDSSFFKTGDKKTPSIYSYITECEYDFNDINTLIKQHNRNEKLEELCF